MIRKYLFLPAALTLALFLMTGSVAQAQHHGGGHGGGHPASHGGGGHAYQGGGGHAYHGGGHAYYGGGHAYYGGGRYYRGGRYYGGIGFYPSYGYGGYGHPYYSYDYPSYYYPPTDYYPSTDYYPWTYDYAAPTTTTTSAYYSPDETAVIRVIVPNSQATVWFNGALTQQTGMDRSFYTPPLTMGANNAYTIRAAWMEGGQRVTQERTISVTPGGNYMVDFSRAAVPGS